MAVPLTDIPEKWMEQLPAVSFINTLERMFFVAIRRGMLVHAIGQFVDHMDDDDFKLLKGELQRADGFARMMIDKRIMWDRWPEYTGPVFEKIAAVLERTEIGPYGAYAALKEIERIIRDRDTSSSPTEPNTPDSGNIVG